MFMKQASPCIKKAPRSSNEVVLMDNNIIKAIRQLNNIC